MSDRHIIDELEQQVGELMAGMDDAEARISELEAALEQAELRCVETESERSALSVELYNTKAALERERANSAVLRKERQDLRAECAAAMHALAELDYFLSGDVHKDDTKRDNLLMRIRGVYRADNPGAGVMEVVRAMKALLPVAKMLYANADGCAVNHYGEDYRKHGQPGWLADALVTITESDKALAALNGGRDA